MQLADNLPENAVQIWRVGLDNTAWDKYTDILGADEHARAYRFQDVQQQVRFLRCRAALRILLGRYAGKCGSKLKYDYSRFGKPQLAVDGISPDEHELHFNLSHCAAVAAIAVSRRPVGIDIEIPAEKDVDALSQLVCHPDEKAAMACLHGARKLQLFYRLWTRKEAFWKAVGTGVRSDLREVSFASFSEAIRVSGPVKHPSGEYFVHDLSFSGGIVGCVSTTLSAPRIEIFTLRTRSHVSRVLSDQSSFVLEKV
jgi:4'-phosphopantetheinyl transferase